MQPLFRSFAEKEIENAQDIDDDTGAPDPDRLQLKADCSAQTFNCTGVTSETGSVADTDSVAVASGVACDAQELSKRQKVSMSKGEKNRNFFILFSSK